MRKPDAAPRVSVGDHQRDAVRAVTAAFKGGNRAQVVMACGTGKTRVGALVHAEMVSRRTVVIVPWLSLVAQAVREWKMIDQDLRHLIVCGDDPRDDEARDPMVGVTTNVEEIRRFTRRPGVVFVTYQSAHLLIEAGTRFNLGIFDEAHKTAGRASRAFGRALRDANGFTIEKRLFMTATPRNAADGASMDDVDMYGPRVYTLTFSDARDRGLIADVKIILGLVTRADLAGEPADRQLVARLAMEKAAARFGVRKFITFHGDVKRARAFADGLRLDGFDVSHVSSKQAAGARAQAMTRFSVADRAIITNARCLTEGVDVPSVDVVVFDVPKRSVVDVVQAAGRAMRLSPSKACGYVLIPILVEAGDLENVDAALRATSFRHVWDIVGDMMDHDNVLADAVRQASIDIGEGRKPRARSVSSRFEVVGADVGVTLDDIEATIVDLVREDWWVRLGELRTAVGNGGAWPKTVGGDAEERRLGRWVTTQRRAIRGLGDCVMTGDRRAALEGLPGWTLTGTQSTTAADTAAFIVANGRRPSPNLGDDDERRLARRATMARHRGDGGVAAVWASASTAREVGTMARVAEVGAWRARCGRMPRANPLDAAEGRLGKLAGNIRSAMSRRLRGRRGDESMALTPQNIGAVVDAGIITRAEADAYLAATSSDRSPAPS